MKSSDRVQGTAQKLSRGRGMCLGNVPRECAFRRRADQLCYNCFDGMVLFYYTVRFFLFSPPSNYTY